MSFILMHRDEFHLQSLFLRLDLILAFKPDQHDLQINSQ
jgi:hypothetical protein